MELWRSRPRGCAGRWAARAPDELPTYSCGSRGERSSPMGWSSRS